METNHLTHTPRPWWIERRMDDALQVNAKHRGEGSSYCVASINHWEGEADKANAQLIATSPDLLAALEGLVLQIEGGQEPSQHAVEIGRATINKARGK